MGRLSAKKSYIILPRALLSPLSRKFVSCTLLVIQVVDLDGKHTELFGMVLQCD